MRHASRHNTAKYSALVRHEFCWAVESITCMSPHALPCAADAVVVYETLPLEDEQVSRIGMSRPHPSLERLENDSSNWHTNTLHEERLYMDGALVIASSLRNTEIKQILSVWSLQAFLRLLGRFREMTRGADRQNTYST